MTEDMRDPDRAVDYIVANAGKFADAKADRVFLEEFRKSKKALLMSESPAKTAVEREQYAYGHPEYIELLAGIKAAIQIEESQKWLMEAAKLRVEVWRSKESSNRSQDRVLR